MKLDAAQRRKVEAQLGVNAVPEEHPATPELKEAFGDHTFFLDADGLSVVEPNRTPEGSSGTVIKLASWAGENHTELLSHRPEVLPVSVDLVPDELDGPGEPDPAA